MTAPALILHWQIFGLRPQGLIEFFFLLLTCCLLASFCICVDPNETNEAVVAEFPPPVVDEEDNMKNDDVHEDAISVGSIDNTTR